MPLRVLICRSNPIDPDPRVEKIARALHGFGYGVTALGWDRGAADSGAAQLPARSQNGPLTIERLLIRAEFGHGMQNLPNLLRWQWRLLSWLARRRKEYDIIHACDFDTVLPSLISKWLWRKKVVYDIFDFYADHLRATPACIKGLIGAVVLWALNRSVGLIIEDDSRWAQIEGAQPRYSTVIYNSPEEIEINGNAPAEKVQRTQERASHLSPEEIELNSTAAESGAAAPSTANELNGMKPLRLAYIGLLQVERGLLEMFDVLERHPQWQMDIAGFGGDEAQIASRAASMPNVTWHGRVPYDKALRLSQAADLLFATYDPTIPNHRYSSPNKVFEAMLLGKPIIVARHTNMDRMIENANCGLVVEYGDRADLEAALQKLEADPGLCAELGANARRAYEETYSWSQMTSRLRHLYQEIESAPPRLVS